MIGPHLPFLNLAANEFPPLLNDVNEDIALLHELTLLTGRIHLEINLQTAVWMKMASVGTYTIVSGFTSYWWRERMLCSFINCPYPRANTWGRWSVFSRFISQWLENKWLRPPKEISLVLAKHKPTRLYLRLVKYILWDYCNSCLADAVKILACLSWCS